MIEGKKVDGGGEEKGDKKEDNSVTCKGESYGHPTKEREREKRCRGRKAGEGIEREEDRKRKIKIER